MGTRKTVEVKILNAFAENKRGGNPAGVVLDADDLSTAQKLEIAGKVGLSETAFVSRSATADFKLDFFTPTKQIAHCGHATLATFSYLRQLGKLTTTESSKETIDGNRRIRLSGELAFMEQAPPAYAEVERFIPEVLRSLGLEPEQVADLPIRRVDTGNGFLIVPVASVTVLQELTPDFDRIERISEALDLIGYYVFATETESADLDATTRMFAPRYGIEEEAGTGMAAGPLACYLHDVAGRAKGTYRIQQGKYMDPPSRSLILVELEVQDGKITGLMAGGRGVVRESRSITLDN